ncbi:N-acetylmuramoyl-L-alanine amidase [Geomonas sp. RF6]|uniref:N-acetylmuramoyl-L-alanine amidase n=1 Tax=Geomonas sp. RF6 TaxID=2897342 RepID=UPI001E460D0C|nr:N-acetylmuramoyl-L-alanine amidase [Geomonas sp. RF6]UFS69866.1 N-acetylmuramoyl-L-alanine amidase [Geomonas sp. RF6]
MNRRDFLKYAALSAPYQQLLLRQFLTREAPLLLAPFFPALALAQGGTSVTELKHWSTPDYTRLSIAVSEEARFEYHKLPGRLYLDIFGARIAPGVKDLSVGDGLLKSVRIAQYNASTVRVVLDLDSIKESKVFTFSDPFRIIVDIKGERRQEISATKEVIETAKPEPVAEKAKKPKERFKAGRIRRIVVDPGHGGHDPGAVSPTGTREKDIVLQVGLKLAEKIREELGIDTVMTRSTDVFIELQERTAIANRVGADLFVSVHANASLNRNANGIETYYLNLAKTEKAAQLAAKENGTSLEKVSMLQAVLFDLMANYKLNDSAHLADEVQKSLHKKALTAYPGVKNLGVKQGPFYVLVGATMPSILVETAFVSNERDEQKLKEPEYQDVTAEGIMLGLKGYISSLNKA